MKSSLRMQKKMSRILIDTAMKRLREYENLCSFLCNCVVLIRNYTELCRLRCAACC